MTPEEHRALGTEIQKVRFRIAGLREKLHRAEQKLYELSSKQADAFLEEERERLQATSGDKWK